MKKPSVLLADDHNMVLEGLCGLLSSEFEILGMVRDGRTLLEEAKSLRPDLVVMDISMPGLNGIDATQQIKNWMSASRWLF